MSRVAGRVCRRRVVAGALWLAAIGALAAIAGVVWRPTSLDLPAGVTRAQYEAAAAAWQRRHSMEPNRADVLVQLGDTFFLDEELEAAIRCYDEIPSSHPLYGPGARLEQAKALIRLNQARRAEHNLRAFLQQLDGGPPVRPVQLFEALDLMRFLLEVQLRFEERRVILAAVHDLNEGGLFETLAFCFPNVLRWNGPQATQWAEEFWEQDPDDAWLRIAMGRYRIGQGRLDEAQTLLEQVNAELPNSLHARAALLLCYYEQDDWDSIKRVFDQLPERDADEPWLLTRLRGHVHNQRGDYDKAIECFQAALSRDPVNAESYLGLAAAYGGLNRQEERSEALRKANVIARIQNRLGWALSKEGDVDALAEIVELCREINEHECAEFVADFARRVAPEHPAIERLESGSAAERPAPAE